MPRVLWAANSYWDSPLPVGANHLARELSERGWDVCFVSDPVTPLHAMAARSRPDVWRRLRISIRGPAEVRRTAAGGRVVAWTPFALAGHANKPLLRSGALLSAWPGCVPGGVRSRLDAMGMLDADLVVIDTVRYGWLLDAVRGGASVARVTDRLAGFAGATPAMIAAERELVSRADHAVCTSLVLLDGVRSWRADGRAHHIGNGVCAAKYAAAGAEKPVIGFDRPAAVYVGTIDAWFDQEMVRRAAEALPGVTFVIAGPTAVSTHALQGVSNVRMLGPVEPAAVPGLLAACDVGIIPFRRDALVDAVCPLKLYEYLACGLPVVSTRWDELERLGSPAVLVDDAAGFAAAVSRAIEAPGDRAALCAFGLSADWGARLDSLLAVAGVDAYDGRSSNAR
jgi:glycosyltransferase involved in cell wall biosynthesis